MTPEGYSKLVEFEGEQFSAHPDAQGFLIIGINHCIDERKGAGISQHVSRELFEDDLARLTATARCNYSWFDHLDAVRQDVIVMLLFDPGMATLHDFLKAIGEHAWHEAAFQLANSNWGRQIDNERKKEMCMAVELGRWN